MARHYCHAGMIGLDGAKMSKSKGNLVFVSRLRGDRVDPMAVRLALLSGHWRTDRSWTADLLTDGQARLHRWREAVSLVSGPDPTELIDRVRVHLADDLDSPGALAAVDAWAEEALRRPSSGVVADAGPRVTAAVDALLGVALH
jgi:L-cysteine:1D-myo-inositol 2-amino-2-deoxy-alpha-D-glucopyranoside ligase